MPTPTIKGWTTTDVRVLTRGHDDDNPIETFVRGLRHPSAPGLAIQPGRRGGKRGWALTHTVSGRRLAFAKHGDSARSLCLTLARLGDWTRDAATIAADAELLGNVKLLLRSLPYIETVV